MLNNIMTHQIVLQKSTIQNVSAISGLFNLNPDVVLQWNSVTSSEILNPGREVLVPIICSRSDQFFQANFRYKVRINTTFSEIACGVFEGLLKSLTLLEANPSLENELKVDSELNVPFRCACPDNFTSSKGVKYLVTYPIIEGDEPATLSKKFGISAEDLWAVNHLEPYKRTIYPNTTGSVASVSLVLVALAACGLYIKALKKLKCEKFHCRSSPISINSCLSPDILAEIKYSLFMYSTEDLKKTTNDFGEESKIGGDEIYKGLINNVEVMIQQTRFENTRQDGPACAKVDIFAFGVILLELISAREDLDGNSFKECIKFLGGESEGGCFEQLRGFMDPSLKEDYPLAEALCLVVLAKACVEDDPLHRPSMDDIMKVLAKMA
uniref:LysM domain-containing protein n=1 Tax=Fagus sylvatica TaxID=28930 RepID=A0A2N9GT31_FAGSY